MKYETRLMFVKLVLLNWSLESRNLALNLTLNTLLTWKTKLNL